MLGHGRLPCMSRPFPQHLSRLCRKTQDLPLILGHSCVTRIARHTLVAAAWLFFVVADGSCHKNLVTRDHGLRPTSTRDSHLPGDIGTLAPLHGQLRPVRHAVPIRAAELTPVSTECRRCQESENDMLADLHQVLSPMVISACSASIFARSSRPITFRCVAITSLTRSSRDCVSHIGD